MKFPNHPVSRNNSWKLSKHMTKGHSTRSCMWTHYRFLTVSESKTRFTETLLVYLKLNNMNCSIHLRLLKGAWPKSYWISLLSSSSSEKKNEEVVIAALWFFFRHKIWHIVYFWGGKEIHIAGPFIDFWLVFVCVCYIMCTRVLFAGMSVYMHAWSEAGWWCWISWN